jgi:hypothetical protein
VTANQTTTRWTAGPPAWENFQRNRISHTRPKWLPEHFGAVGISDGAGGTCRGWSGVIAYCDYELADTIAAAPDLLDALVEALPYVEMAATRRKRWPPRSIPPPRSAELTCRTMRAAIAKATGGAP